MVESAAEEPFPACADAGRSAVLVVRSTDNATTGAPGAAGAARCPCPWASPTRPPSQAPRLDLQCFVLDPAAAGGIAATAGLELCSDVPPERYFDVTVDLNTEIIGLTHTDDVDVVILNTAPPLLAFEVISTGRLLHGSHDDRVTFEVGAIKRFHDTEPIRRLQQRAFRTRIDALAEALGEGKGKW